MIFEDGADPNARSRSEAADVVSKNSVRMEGNTLMGQNKASTELVGPQQVKQNNAKIGEDPNAYLDSHRIQNNTNQIAKLRALRASNLDQQNADIENEDVKADFSGLKNKLEKNLKNKLHSMWDFFFCLSGCFLLV